MIDLTYPARTAVILGKSDPGTSEMLPVVDESGIVTAQASRALCHERRYMHPVIHLHVMNRFSELYLQRRSATKKLLPLFWDTAVGGHISYGEYVEEALYREAGEELNLYDFHPQLIDSYVFESEVDRELVFVFATVGNFSPSPDKEEVSEGRYWTMDEIESSIGKSILTPQFETEFARIKDKLLALL